MINGTSLNELAETGLSVADALRAQQLIDIACLEQSHACIEDIDFTAGRKLDRFLIQRLSSGEYIADMYNIIITGPAGAGKSYLACAFGTEACKQYYTVKYVYFPDVLLEVKIAKEIGSYKELIDHYLMFNLLIIDEWLQYGLTEDETNNLIELLLARYKQGSTIFCTLYLPQTWHEKIGDLSMEDAILNRIVRNSYIIELMGMENMPLNNLYQMPFSW